MTNLATRDGRRNHAATVELAWWFTVARLAREAPDVEEERRADRWHRDCVEKAEASP